MKEIRYKCWIEEDNEKFYGPGPNELLKQIHKEGSLSKAAAGMNMSYKKAWSIVQRLNHHSKEPMVILKKGGQHGGGAEVTSLGLKVINEFENLQNRLNEVIDQQIELINVLK